MPELPEVEAVRRIIEPQIAGRKILSVEIRNPQIIAHPTSEEFSSALERQQIASMSRRGKFLSIHFKSGDRLSLHLRMTGRLFATPLEMPIEKHTHLICKFSGNMQLRYVDTRRFGRFWFFKEGEADIISGQSKLRLEPTDSSLTVEYLKAKIGAKGKAIKEILLDQKIVAGIGNIYADEILFSAKIHPAAKCSSLSDSDWKRLAEKSPK